MTTFQRCGSIFSITITSVPIILYYAYAAATRNDGSLWALAFTLAATCISVCIYVGYFSKEQGNGS